MKNLILGYKRGDHRWRSIEKALKTSGQEVDMVIEDTEIETAIEKLKQLRGDNYYDKIFTISESLLPLQAKLEKEIGLNNISERAADILSDKKKFDDFCISIGLESLIPHSIIPTKSSDLDYWEDKSFIVKPVIGSGGKRGNLNYVSFKNKKEFLKFANDNFFDSNKNGWKDSKFNNLTNYYMIQEELPINGEVWGPYYYVNTDGTIKNLLWVRAKLFYNKIDNYRHETKLAEWMSFDNEDVPDDIKSQGDNFYDKVINNLSLRNMFFSGPDFYKWDDNIKMIDCNPRLGQGLVYMDDIHDNKIISKVLNDKLFSFDKKMLWKISKLRPGKIKSVKDLSHLQNYFCKTNNDKLIAGNTIEEYTHITSTDIPRIAFLITGTNESDMYKTYQIVNNQLQDCIEYY